MSSKFATPTDRRYFEDYIPGDVHEFGSIPVDFEDHPVSAAVSGLDPAKIYRFRIVAINANGTSNSTDASAAKMTMMRSLRGRAVTTER